MATRDELEALIAECMAEFRASRALVDATELRLERAFALAEDADQFWFVGKVMAGMGELVAETPGRRSAIVVAMQAAEGGPVH